MISQKITPSITEIAPFICQSLDEGKRVRLTVTGMSMYPMLRDRMDSVIIEKADSFCKYDVVLYKRANGKYVLHRIVGVHGDSFTFAGDNELAKEYGIERANCIGKMKAFERSGKTYDANLLWYRLYSRMWVCFFSFRRPLGKVLRLIARIYKRLK
ncbi:MAG: S24/S26 family peptidase [Clostridia bacterium]|nr:S24/S26 family peptidase [Clostridia bacterium]